ncbi:MAG TPA: HIT domain-containing protein [Anaerolineae bacterium]|nr:HIT domain-containing protein [Anaerolineae bacterium]HMR63685.1 HIT domain-containing protein [Anaerolineae bacterium]
MTIDRLYTPWRMDYVTSTKKNENGCIFCAKSDDAPEFDRDNYLLFRGPNTFVVMNIYPYNTGHLMILPYDHVSSLMSMSPEARCEMMHLTSYFTELLSTVMRPDGFNVGMNLGRAAGAGIDSHLHLHLVPRWNGDSSFMAVVSNTRVLPETLEATYERILTAMQQNPPQL